MKTFIHECIQIAQIDTSITVEGTFDEHDYRSAAVIVHST